MEATIIKIKKEISKYTNKPVYAVFFKAESGSYKSWVDPGNGNFRNWDGLLVVGNVVGNLKIKAGRLIDADSRPTLIREAHEEANVKADIDAPRVEIQEQMFDDKKYRGVF